MDARLQKIRSQWPDARLLSLRGVPQDSNPNAIFQCVVGADPSKTHKYVAWTLKAWENNGLQFEDIETGSESKTAETLSEFERFKNRIGNPRFENQNTGLSLRDAKDRSLLRYKTPGDLYKAVRPWVIAEQEYGETASSKEQKRLDMMKARLESYHEETPTGLKIDIPATVFAAQKLGQKTKWCTSAINNNMFKSYAEKGELYIITLPTGEKFQAHSDINVYDDDDDREIDEDDIDWNGDEDDEPEDTGVDYTKSSLVAFLEYIRVKMEGNLLKKHKANREDPDIEDYIVASIARRMDIMDETDNNINKSSGKNLMAYNEEIGTKLAGFMLNSILKRAETSTIPQEFIDEFKENLKEKIISRLNQDCQQNSPDLTPAERKDKEKEYFQEREDMDAQAKTISHNDLFNKLKENDAFTEKDGALTLNIPGDMSLVDYIIKFADIIRPKGMERPTGVNEIVDEQEWTKLCHDLLDKISISKELADTFHKVTEKFQLNVFESYTSRNDTHYSRKLFCILTGLVAKQRIDTPKYIDNKEDAMGILADIRLAERYSQYSMGILECYAPTSFLETMLEKEASNDRITLIDMLHKRLRKDGVSPIKRFEKILALDTANVAMESDDHRPEHIKDVVSKHIKKIIVNNLIHWTCQVDTNIDASNINYIKKIITNVIDTKIPDILDVEKDNLFHDIFSETFQTKYLNNAVAMATNSKSYELFYRSFVNENIEASIPNIIKAFDSGVMTKDVVSVLRDMRMNENKIKSMGYENFPERYHEVICLLTNIREDKGVHYDEMGSQTTQRSGSVQHINSTDKTELLQIITNISSSVSNPSKDFLLKIEEEKEKLWEQKGPLSIEQMYSLKCLQIHALQIEDVVNKRTHDIISLLKENDVITADEADIMRDEKPMNTRHIRWLEDDLKKLIEKKKGISHSL